MIAGGLVLVTVLGDRIFGHTVTRREWIGVALTAAGLAFLAATLEGTADEAHSDYDELALYGTIAATTVAAIVLAARGGASGPALAVSAGLLWAGSDITIKALSDHTDLGLVGVVLHPFALDHPAVVARRPARVGPQSLQLGPVVSVIALTSATANVLTIAAGPTVFGEPLPEDPGALLIRLAAFALVITAAAMTPPPGADRAGAGRRSPSVSWACRTRGRLSRSAVVTGIRRGLRCAAVDVQHVDARGGVERVDRPVRRIGRREVRGPERAGGRVVADLLDVARVGDVEEAHALVVPALGEQRRRCSSNQCAEQLPVAGERPGLVRRAR